MNKLNKIIILDNGHGQETPGKRSPDGIFREYAWTRMFVKKLKCELERFGYIVYTLVPEDEDISLNERVSRVNELYKLHNCILLSIHNNAAGDGKKWYKASGFEVYTSPGNTSSDKLAEILYQEAEYEGIKIRTDLSDGDKDKEKNFTVLTKTKCPAVLVENLFMDSKDDVLFLTSDYGINKLLKIYVTAIRRYLEDPEGTRNNWIINNIGWDKEWLERSRINKCDLK